MIVVGRGWWCRDRKVDDKGDRSDDGGDNCCWTKVNNDNCVRVIYYNKFK